MPQVIRPHGFTNAAIEYHVKSGPHDLFGSGWVWLAAGEDRVEVISAQNAETPFVYGLAPILVLDMWEHSYYLDYQNDKKKYVDAFFDDIVNWKFAAQRLAGL